MAKKKSFFRRAWKWFWNLVLSIGLIQWIIAVLIAIPIWFVYLTSKIKITNYETFKKYRKKPAIFVFWHGRSMMLSPIIAVGGMRAYAVASKHHDGRIMAKLQRLFGLRPIYGSTSDGGLSVLRGGLHVLSDGRYSMCISPDGPGGPSLRIQDGTMYFAKMSGAPIIPVCYSASRCWFMDNWDKYMVVKPFSCINCIVGEPVFVPRRASDEEFASIKEKLENYMVKTLHQMDGEFNHPELAAEYKRQIEEKNKELDVEFKIDKVKPLVMPYDVLPDVTARAEVCYQAMGFLMQPIAGWNQTSVRCDEGHATVQLRRSFGTLGDFYTIATELMPGAFVQELSDDLVSVRVALPKVETIASIDERDTDTIIRDVTTIFQGMNTIADIHAVTDTVTNGVDTAYFDIVEIAASSKLVPMQFMQMFENFGGVYLTACDWNATNRTWNYEVIIYAKQN